MCTVTFIPVKDKFIITSNRDEKFTRKKAIPPTLYHHNGWGLLFPKDTDAGGTWIALKENGDAAVLLNGAFIRHSSQPPYRKSRGVLLLDVLASDRSSWAFSKTDLMGIEPFTIILFEKGCLYEFRWDGTERYCRQLSVNRSHIWSSSTLYDGFVSKKREQWLAAFLNRTPYPTQQDVLNFHRFTGDKSKGNGILMTADGLYSTVSITSILLTADRGNMKYVDVNDNKVFEKNIELVTVCEFL